ncbi:di-heme oxidoredictase family protein [Xanthocytophaga agilis]|uniref:Di-heme oxidoredictase family protein n=1 Tax=Xanthocytophaga agilis TaxID=3048010 RepID=A0AAE3R7P6_9BACT|nr:di-heme oxidoredictase family protein [Xanthocytophaga agilis]MDJ1505376.1 di-heme oxidoredictase family protein [Xanthocytophaga agilis]
MRTPFCVKSYQLILGMLAGSMLCVSACKSTEADIQRASAEDKEQYSGGDNLTSNDLSDNAFGKQANNITFDEGVLFVVGNSLFQSNWVTAPSSVTSLDGLGPLMNQSSCGGCHFKDGRAKPPATETATLNGLLFRLSIPGTGVHGEPVHDPVYGEQLQDKAILGVTPESSVRVTYQPVSGQYEDGTIYTLQKPVYELYNPNFGSFHAGLMVSPRIAQQIPGLGLLEAVAEQTILSFADETDKNKDGISGRPNYVWDVVNNKTSLGRFGWKANVATIKQQTAGALQGDMGITSSVFPASGLSESENELYSSLPNGGSPEISDEQLNKIIFYVQTLSVPVRRDWTDKDILRGKYLFSQLNCSGCHIPKMQTAGTHTVSVLNNQTIRPYTDMLLHDMGEGLADNRPDFLANGQEWRTPPLWGIGMVKTVNKHTNFLHDGRAFSLEEAVLWHGGEAEKSATDFKKLSATDRVSLIKFLESL